MYSNIPNSEIQKMMTNSLAISKSESDPVLMKNSFEKQLDSDVKELAFRLGKDYLQLWDQLMQNPEFTSKLNDFEQAIEQLMDGDKADS